VSCSRLSALVLLTLLLAGSAQARSQALHLQLVRSGFSSPLYVTAPANEPNNLYVVEQGGKVRLLSGGKLQPKPFLDLSSLVSSGGERGLLSIAFSPGYAQNQLVYVDYTDTNGNTRVVEYRLGGGGKGRGSKPGTRELLFVQQPFANHNGGQLQFGPDGRLYVGLGDGGGTGDPNDNAQNLSSSLGKILAADVSTLNWQIVGYGLRNPWRFSFDRSTGALYVADVGQNAWEEVDYRQAGAGQTNYGWSRYEGSHDYNTGIALAGSAPVVFPVHEYDHSSGRCAVTGGYVYRGAALPDQVGRYFFGDYCSGTVWSLKIVGGAATDLRVEPFTVSHLSSFGEGADGELYLVSLDGSVYRLAE
jgi:glucose/arabinose dehydrogenase